jgi:hypothetical protein
MGQAKGGVQVGAASWRGRRQLAQVSWLGAKGERRRFRQTPPHSRGVEYQPGPEEAVKVLCTQVQVGNVPLPLAPHCLPQPPRTCPLVLGFFLSSPVFPARSQNPSFSTGPGPEKCWVTGR